MALVLASIATLIGTRSAWTMSGTSVPRNDYRRIAIGGDKIGGGGWVGEFYKAVLCVVPASPPLRKPRLSHQPPRASAFHRFPKIETPEGAEEAQTGGSEGE